MEQFKNNETNVMLATPNSVRGLDFPQVTHVYTLYLPTEDPREYIHLAGRVGRVGQVGSVRGAGGQVFSILKSEDGPKMDFLAKELGFDFRDVSAVEVDIPKMKTITTSDDRDDHDRDDEEKDDTILLDPNGVDEMRRYLEDTVALLSLEGDVADNDSSIKNNKSVQLDEINEDDP